MRQITAFLAVSPSGPYVPRPAPDGTVPVLTCLDRDQSKAGKYRPVPAPRRNSKKRCNNKKF